MSADGENSKNAASLRVYSVGAALAKVETYAKLAPNATDPSPEFVGHRRPGPGRKRGIGTVSGPRRPTRRAQSSMLGLSELNLKRPNTHFQFTAGALR